MNFDAGRAVALADELERGRLPGSDAQRRVAARMAAELERAGLVVQCEQVSYPGEPGPISAIIGIGAILAGGLLMLIAWANHFLLGADPYTLAIGFGGLAMLALLERRLRTGCWFIPDVAVPVIQAESQPSSGSETPQIVLHTSLNSRRARSARWIAGLLTVAELLWLAALLVPCLMVSAWIWLGKAGPGLMIALGVLTLLGRLGRRLASPDADNRTGLALLVELARGWPSVMRTPVSARFVASAAPYAPRAAGSRVLLVDLDAPGLGDQLVLSGSERFPATRAARDLWLPVHVVGGLPASGLRLSSPTEDGPINPAMFIAAAQLITELALRWVQEQDGSSLVADRPGA